MFSYSGIERKDLELSRILPRHHRSDLHANAYTYTPLRAALQVDRFSATTMSNDEPTRRKSYNECSELSDFCPVEATVLGYAPNLGASIFFTVAFGIVLSASIFLTVWKRTWSYSAGLTAGLVLETAGSLPLGEKKKESLRYEMCIHVRRN